MESRELPSRQEIMDNAVKRWQTKLFDLGRRNNLLYYHDLKSGTLRLEKLCGNTLEAFMDGQPVDMADLAPDTADLSGILGKTEQVRAKAVSNLEEKGIRTLFIAYGMAAWRSPDTGRPPCAPVFLIPADIEAVGRLGKRFTLRKRGEPAFNPVLRYTLINQFGATELDREDINDLHTKDFSGAFREIQKLANLAPDFTIEPAVILSNFSYQKSAMVEDLQELGGVLADNDVIAALAGVPEAAQTVFNQPLGAGAYGEDLDQLSPDEEFTVLDADSSQQSVIRAVLKGRSGVIMGPPGTGKSQTIVNIIAEMSAAGKSVLFVAEKRAALDVVLSRLDGIGLGHLTLDLQNAENSKSAIPKQIQKSLDDITEVSAPSPVALHEQLSSRRSALNDYVQSLHKARQPSGLSVYELQGRILQDQSLMDLGTRWRGEALHHLVPEVCTAIEESVRELASLYKDRQSPWFRVKLESQAKVLTAISAVQELAASAWRPFERQYPRLIWDTLPDQTATLENFDALLALFGSVAQTLAIFDERIYRTDLHSWQNALQPGAGSGLGSLIYRLFNAAYKNTVHELQSLARPGSTLPKPPDALRNVAEQIQQWREHLALPGNPELNPEYASALQAWPKVREHITTVSEVTGLPLWSWTLRDYTSTINAMANDSVTPHRVLRAFELTRQLSEQGMELLLHDLQDYMPYDQWAGAFRQCYALSCLDQAYMESPSLPTLTRENHERLVEEFRTADQGRLVIARQRVAQSHAERARHVMVSHSEQAALLRREAAKKSHHLPLRQLLTRAPDTLLALRPCWVASPLNVSQLLPGQQLFDLVLMDEGSQVLPEDAIAAFARGRQAVVAGDSHQLPPTTFFAASDDDEQTDDIGGLSSLEGFESILDVMSSLASPLMLQWHYRSRDERLIAFSNHHIYGQSLITFPGCRPDPPVEHVLVSSPESGEAQASPSGEAVRVAELIVAQATAHPGQSLGVITLGLPHAQRIEMALQEIRRNRPDLDAFFDPHNAERFFIKNLERVQGDERDSIILSVGYGKDASGHLPYRFGPLLNEGGERRLNVAITRAREHMTVVSSFDHHDMDPDRNQAKGVSLLREYLAFAASGGNNLRTEQARSGIPLNSFELAVRDALIAEGLQLESQWGVSRFRLDFAVKHPRYPGQFVLAIECDGASYHSAPTARDRDRLRQQQLEALGWRFHRIWSTEWFRDAQNEIRKTLEAYKDAVSAADAARRESTPSLRPLAPVVDMIQREGAESTDAAHVHRKSP